MADAGTISGQLELDTSRWDGPLRDAKGRFVRASDDLSDALASAGRRVESDVSSRSRTVEAVLTGAIGGITAAMTNFAGQAVGRAAAAMKAFVTDSVALAAANEQVAISFEVMVGSASGALDLMEQIRIFAATTPFQLPEINNAAKQLLGFGIEADKIVDVLRMLGDVSSGLNIPLGDLSYLYGQLATKGRLMTEELNQFSARGIPLAAELSKQFGVTNDELRKMVQEGQVGFPAVQQALAAMTGEGGRFYEMTLKQSQSAAGLYSTLLDGVDELKRAFGGGLIGEDGGKALIGDLISEAEKLKPVFVDAGQALAVAIRDALPAIREVLNTTNALIQLVSGKKGADNKANRAGFSNADAVELVDQETGEDAAQVKDAYDDAAAEAKRQVDGLANEVARRLARRAFAPKLGVLLKWTEDDEAMNAILEAQKALNEAEGGSTTDVAKAVEQAVTALRLARDASGLRDGSDPASVTRIIDPVRSILDQRRRQNRDINEGMEAERINVTVPGIDEQNLAEAITTRLEPKIREQIRQASAAADAAAARSRAQEGL